MIAAFALPRILDRLPDRPVMLAAASILPLALIAMAMLPPYLLLLAIWVATGFAYASAQTPSGRLLRRSSSVEDRPALFAAHFAASHACWLLCYPLAGWLGSLFGLAVAAWALAGISLVGVVTAFLVWPRTDAETVPHVHSDLPADHPHLADHRGAGSHRHALVIDELHPRWP